MKAAVIHKFGDIDVLKYEDIETPKPKPGHILIKVLAAGVNRFDHYIREGSVVPELPFPHILGADAAGEVAELGEGVTGFEIGERVVPITGYPFKVLFVSEYAKRDLQPREVQTQAKASAKPDRDYSAGQYNFYYDWVSPRVEPMETRTFPFRTQGTTDKKNQVVNK